MAPGPQLEKAFKFSLLKIKFKNLKNNKRYAGKSVYENWKGRAKGDMILVWDAGACQLAISHTEVHQNLV